jgi:hypothetical protein
LKALIRLEQRKPEQVSKVISKSAVAVPVFEKVSKPAIQAEVVSKTSVALPMFSPKPEEQPTDPPKPEIKTTIDWVKISIKIKLLICLLLILLLLFYLG